MNNFKLGQLVKINSKKSNWSWGNTKSLIGIIIHLRYKKEYYDYINIYVLKHKWSNASGKIYHYSFNYHPSGGITLELL
jgi:hypothetical protein